MAAVTGRPSHLVGLGILAALLSACGGAALTPESGIPSMYLPLTTGSASVDAAAARDMISAYRRNHGEAVLAIDPDLQKLAETEAAAMAASDKPSRSQTVRNAIGRLGYVAPEANLSAGYHTLAEAFSGWRDSPPHNAVMLAPEATRMGIATAYAPGSKYMVYWALLVAK